MSRRGQRAVDALARSLDRPGATLALAVPIVVMMSIGVFLGTGEHDWFELCWYLAYFVVGFVLVSDDRFLAAVRRDGRVALGTAITSTFVLTATPAAGLLASIEGGLDLPHFLAGMLFGLEGWAWTLVILNVGMQVSALQRPLAARLNEAVLPVYVIHQPVILAVAFFVVQWPLGILPKWIAVFGISAAITVVLVQLGLRFRVSRVLLGARAQLPGPVPVPGSDPKTMGLAWPGARGAGGSHARPR